MNFSCNKCQRRYSIADDKVRGKTVKVRCKNCQNVISVEGPPQEAEESTRVVSLADVERLREQSLAEEEAAAAAEVAAAPAAAASQSWDDEPTRTMPLRDARSPWFVMVKSKQEGPLDESALAEMVAAGTITARSYFWQQGMPDWKRGSDIAELASLFAPAAPPPPPPPASVRAPPPPVPEPEPVTVAQPEQSSTSWQPEPPPPSQTTWQQQPASRRPAPAAERMSAPWDDQGEQEQQQESEQAAAASNSAQLGELFSDLDLPQSEQQAGFDPGGPGFDEGGQQEDPLAPLGQEDDRRAPVENTQHFVKKAGVDRRNPPWKIALFVVLLLGVPVGLLYALTELQVVPLRVTRVDAQGNAVEEPVSVFSAEGMGELRDLMLGRAKPPPPPPEATQKVEPKARPAEPVKEEPPAQEAAQPEGEAPKDAAAAALYAEADKKDVGPEVREDTEVAATDSAEQSGPPQEEIARVVSQSQSAFKSCIERALRRNPQLRDTKVLVTATVGSSGKVKKVSFDREDVDGSPMGNCLKLSAKRMVFPSFSGDEVEVEIPLVVTKSM